MIRFIVLLANLETKVKKATKGKGNNKPNSQIVQREYEQLVAETEPYKRALPERPSLGPRVRASFKNVKNVIRNAYDNTVGYGIAKYQNVQTRRHFKKKPESQDKIVYLMHGLFQNEGSQRKLASQLKKKGYRPYHLKGYHHLAGKEGADKGFEQIEKFHKKTGLKEPRKRSDYFSGHSSGADRGIYMAGDERIKKYGIKEVQARAPAPTGIEAKTLGQKLIMPIVSGKENVKYPEGKRAAVDLSSRRPKVPVHVIAGRYDSLVPPKNAAYQHAEAHYVIEHPDSTHFGTSGVNPTINELLIDMLGKKPPRYKRKGQVLEKQEGQNKRYYKMAA